MNLVAIEAPAPRVAPAREAFELLNAAFGIVAAGYALQIVSNHLIKTLAKGCRLLAGLGHDLLID